MTLNVIGYLFNVGELVITRGAWDELTNEDVWHNLVRHMSGDWGIVCEFDWERNDRALEKGGRLLSSYSTHSGTVFWIITEHNRSVTTILLPAEY